MLYGHLASYPPDLTSLKIPPNVSVEVVFSNALGTQAWRAATSTAERHLYASRDCIFPPYCWKLVSSCLRMPHLRLDEGRGKLTDAVQKLTGLDGLSGSAPSFRACAASRDYLAYKKAELASSRAEFGKQIERARTALSSASVVVLTSSLQY